MSRSEASAYVAGQAAAAAGPSGERTAVPEWLFEPASCMRCMGTGAYALFVTVAGANVKYARASYAYARHSLDARGRVSLRAMREVMVLGCGYTGTRVSTRLLSRGVRVVAAAREASALASIGALGATVVEFEATLPESWKALTREATRLEPGYALLVSIPPLRVDGEPPEATAALLASLPRPGRTVYLSSTAVYGDQVDVDAATSPAPRTPDQALRLLAEHAVAAGPWSSMVLRAAAIYGPERGLHIACGTAPRRAGHPDRVVSRIHVDDLAALCVAALGSSVTGAYPAADRAPASARAVAAFCASLGLVPPSLPDVHPGASRGAARRVDGRAVFEALGLSIAYPSYREGILAAPALR